MNIRIAEIQEKDKNKAAGETRNYLLQYSHKPEWSGAQTLEFTRSKVRRELSN